MIRCSVRVMLMCLVIVSACAFTEVYAYSRDAGDCKTELAEYRLQIADKQLEEIQLRLVLQKLEGEYGEITGARKAIHDCIGRASTANDVAWYLNLGAGLLALPRLLTKLSILKGTQAAVTSKSTSAISAAGEKISALARFAGLQGVGRYYKPKAEEALKELDAAITQLKMSIDRIKQRHNEIKNSVSLLEERKTVLLRKCAEDIEREQSERIDVTVMYSRKKLRTQANMEIIQDLVVVTNNSNRDVTIQNINQDLRCLDDGWTGGGAFPPSPGGKVYTMQVKAGATAKVAEARWQAQTQGNRRLHTGSITIITNLGTFTSNKARYSNATYIGHIPVAQWR